MCYLPSISEQIPGLFGDIDKLAYVKYQLNISYRLYPIGYSTAYIEYKVTDLNDNRKLSTHGRLSVMSPYVEQICHMISTFYWTSSSTTPS